MGMAFSGFQAPQLTDPSLLARIPAPGGEGFNAPGGLASKLGNLSDFLGRSNHFAQAQQQPMENDFKNRQLDLQSQIANTRADTEPASIKALRAAGIDPASPYGQSLIAGNLNRPIIVGNGDTGFTPIGGAFGMPGAGGAPPSSGGGAAAGVPAVTDAASYAAIPSGSQFRDPDGNIRVKP